MTDKQNQTALVTGANSGLGFEASALLAEAGYGKVILATRTVEKGQAARKQLLERTSRDVFEVIAVDVAEVKSAYTAADELSKRGTPIDLLILNAGMSPGENRAWSSDGIELTFASSIIGHHVLTMRLLEAGFLSADAHIVIAGSEGARGDFPGMDVVDFTTFANQHFAGELVPAFEAIARYQQPYEDSPMNVYVTTKTFTNWWAAVLARKLPDGMVVNAVSPGSVPDTNFARHQSFFMKRIMLPVMDRFGHLMGMAWSRADGAGRYLTAGEFSPEITGHFFASPPGKFTGPMEIQKNDHFLNPQYQEAGWQAIENLSGVAYPTRIHEQYAQKAASLGQATPA